MSTHNIIMFEVKNKKNIFMDTHLNGHYETLNM